MINVHHSTFDMNHPVINPKESTKVHLRNFTPPLHGLCFIPVFSKSTLRRDKKVSREADLNHRPKDDYEHATTVLRSTN